MTATGDLEARVARELRTPAMDQAVLVDAIRARFHVRFHDCVVAILFYGACRRSGDMTGLLDLYVLLDDERGYRGAYRRWLPALSNRLLPPNVIRVVAGDGPDRRTAKVAIISCARFARAMRPGSLDTTLWARFCQPVSLLYARDAAAERRVAGMLADAIRTAVGWARRHGAADADRAALWQGLFARTYRLELRPESRNRPGLIQASGAAWFDEVMALVEAEDRAPIRLSWLPRYVCGRPLNVLRLLKSAFTYDGGVDYLADKLSRHTGASISLAPWQRRHPLLAAPALIWKARRAR